MTQLTKEYFDKQMKLLATKQDVQGAVDELARVVNTAFDAQSEYLEKEFSAIRKELDIRKLVEQHQRKFQKLERALHVKL